MKLLAVVTSFIFVFVLIPGVVNAGPAFSGITANADTAETVVTNPAGMTRFSQPTGYGNPQIFYTDDKDEIKMSNAADYKYGDDSFFALPGLYYLQPVGQNWAVGIGPNAALGLGGSYDDDWAGRYLMKSWSLNFVGIAPSVAYRINDKFSVGASLPIMYSQYTLEKAVYNLDPDEGDGDFELTADGWGVGVNVGFLYEPTAHTRFGLVYRSKVSVTEEGNPEYSGLTAERKELLNKFGALNQDISVDTSTPQMVFVGVFHDFQNGWSASLDASWMDFSDWGLENVTIGDSEISTKPGNYNDIWAAALGVNYKITPKITAKGGVFYVSSAQDDEERTTTMRFDQMYGAGLGFEYEYKKDRSVAIDLTYIQFGDGKFKVKDAPVVGDIEGEYTRNYGLALGIGMKW